jgi:hypothetical protein
MSTVACFGRFPKPSRGGLRGRTPVDMRAQPWGELRAVEQGFGGHWWFECPSGHRTLLNGDRVRRAAKVKGKFPTCKECERCNSK